MTQQLERTELIGARSEKSVALLYLPRVEVLLVMDSTKSPLFFSLHAR